jgi:hypothetical protein
MEAVAEIKMALHHHLMPAQIVVRAPAYVVCAADHQSVSVGQPAPALA